MLARRPRAPYCLVSSLAAAVAMAWPNTGGQAVSGGVAAGPQRRFNQARRTSSSYTANVLRIADRQHPDDPIYHVDLTLHPQSALPLVERTLSLAVPDRPSWFDTRLIDWMSFDGLWFRAAARSSQTARASRRSPSRPSV
jgi:hypothetical protein